jgi:pyrroloquinoline quinone biosynthesis protein E
MTARSHPRLAPHVRAHYDTTRKQHALLDPERVTFVSSTAQQVLKRCDGAHTIEQIASELSDIYTRASSEAIARDVARTVASLSQRGLLTVDAAGSATMGPDEARGSADARLPHERLLPPLALTAELTYRCPLRCGYCSNPVDLRKFATHMSADRWRTALHSAADAGVLQCSFSGGEPLLFDGLESLVQTARSRDMYCNLITSAWGLDQARVAALRDSGLEHVQVSLQHVDEAKSDAIAGAVDTLRRKRAAMKWVVASGMALSINFVLHRASVDAVEQLLHFAASEGALRVELASVQSHGWALRNRDGLLPSAAQCAQVDAVVARFREQNSSQMRVIHVVADYYAGRPKPCMDGWGRKFLTLTPDGTLLPCPGAHELPLPFEKFDARGSIDEHWRQSPVFSAFRGEQWMTEPCASCDERSKDFGGCRCQAFALTGSMAQTDPACSKSPAHAVIVDAQNRAQMPVQPLVQLRTQPPLTKDST